MCLHGSTCSWKTPLTFLFETSSLDLCSPGTGIAFSLSYFIEKLEKTCMFGLAYLSETMHIIPYSYC